MQTLIAAIPDPLRRAPLATTKGELPNPLSPPDGCAFSPRCGYAEAVCHREPGPSLETRPDGHSVNGTHFTDPSGGSWTVADIKAMIERKEPFWAHAFDVACARNDIDHRLTKPKHPWTNGQVERMNRTIKDATVKRFHYDTHDELRSHLADFVSAYNFAKRLKTLKGLTPYEYMQSLDKTARTIHLQSAPANAGTKHLDAGFDFASNRLELAQACP
jgi:oligopeptide/dipeptide ABC transporter ATP-binding protein